MPTPKVLILDDEKEINNLIRTVLARSGYDAVSCYTGEEAVDAFKTAAQSDSPVKLLLLDLTIPMGMDGKQALSVIRETDPNIPAIATSGYDEESAGAAEAGFTAFIGKPFDISELRRQVAEILSPSENS